MCHTLNRPALTISKTSSLFSEQIMKRSENLDKASFCFAVNTSLRFSKVFSMSSKILYSVVGSSMLNFAFKDFLYLY